MKRLAMFFLVLCLCTTPLSVSAAQTDYVCDYADLLTVQQEQELRIFAQYVFDNYGLCPVILTVNSLEGKSPWAYADDYYDYSGYGTDGILLLVSIEERDWYISTSGTAVSIFSDRVLYALEDTIFPYLSYGDYYGAFSAFLSSVPDCCDDYADVRQPRGIGSILIVSLFIGSIVAAVVLLVMRSSMNTKRRQHNAGNYLIPGSFRMTVHRDMFLYSQVTRTRRQQQTNSGSTTHRSSSGRSHGGRGGKF